MRIRGASSLNRRTLIGGAAFALVANVNLAATSASANAQQDGQSSAAIMPQQEVGMSSELRQRIEVFLTRRFHEQGLSRDLLDITMTKIDAEATAWQSARHPQYPRTSVYPSVAQQISWQHSLQMIAEEFEREFPSGYVPRRLSVQVSPENGVFPPPSTAYLLWRVPSMIAGAQGEFSEKFAEARVEDFPGTLGQPRQHFGQWVQSLRITATGEKHIDDRILAEVTRLLESGSSSGIDSDSFPAPVSMANVYIPSAEFNGSVRGTLWLCLQNIRCTSMFDLAHFSRFSSTDASNAQREELFRQLYLTNPFGGRNSASALIQVNESGGILSAHCGHHDLGYSSLRFQQPFSEHRLSFCLSEMHSPGTGEIPEEDA